MSLVREIMNGATDSQIDITTVLRKCKILAARLKSAEFAGWVDHELNGYPDTAALPSYRVLRTSAKAHLVDKYGRTQLPNALVMSRLIPEQFRHWAEQARLTAPISAYASLLGSDGEAEICVEWPQELAVKFGSVGYMNNMECLRARQVFSKGQLIALVDTVRNRIVDFALKIDEAAPDAGEAAPGVTPIPQDRVTQIVNTYVTGGVNNIAAAASNFSQTSSAEVQSGDWNSLEARLAEIGVPAGSITELQQELGSSNDARTTVTQWLGKLAMAGATTLATGGVEHAAKAIAAYLGWS